MPAPGNHEYNGSRASGYFQYWGDRAGEAVKGYYSYDLGGWHVVVLNTNCSVPALGGCQRGSPQEVWLREELGKAPGRMHRRLRTIILFSVAGYSLRMPSTGNCVRSGRTSTRPRRPDPRRARAFL